ncbi:hypothetical protein BGZ99_009462 [Dissophora globulifera]|uniref:Uncharacterized protein n=1 Tax=Dissophora globulifera TaxID=979702 RepID=A0A9P6UNE1_9FUNG|nr:hypothetical protein BGZ99_009462 [Dissophora globulifera]
MSISLTRCTGTLAFAALSSLTWLQSVSANIKFNPIPVVTAANPGDVITITWVEVNANGTTLDTNPINIFLRALTGQQYELNKGVPQNDLSAVVTLPKTATGGLHSFYADYSSDGLKSVSSSQFNITGPIVTTTAPAPIGTPTRTGAPAQTAAPGSGGGLSGAVLGGIIGGVVAFLLVVAIFFFCRHRRRVREHSEHTRLEDTKESFSEASASRSGLPSPSSAHFKGRKEDGDMVPIPLSGPGSRPPHPNEQQYGPGPGGYGGPQPRPPMQHPNGNGNKNPFDGPEEMMMGGAAVNRAGSLSPRQQHQAYQPPQPNQQPPRPNQPYGMSPSQSPFQSSRDSLESEAESAYDPSHPRMMNQNMHSSPGGNGPIHRNNSNPMMRAGGGPLGSQLSHSPSGRSNLSDGRPNMSPQPNPFQDRELMSAAAGDASGPMRRQGSQNQLGEMRSQSPMMNRSPSQNQLGEMRSQSPIGRSASPRIREIEMQPLDVQQHQYEQHQRAMQRRQQQEQQQQQQQPTSPKSIQQQPATAFPLPPQAQNKAAAPAAPAAPTVSAAAAAHPFNPTLHDDKTEMDEDGIPVYNGYRDTIFGAYSQPQGDDDDDDEDEAPMPIIAPHTLNAFANSSIQQQQQSAADVGETTPAAGAPGIQRKKSVKFTGVPVSGPIVVPAAQEPVTQVQEQPRQSQDEDHEDSDEDEYEDAEEEEEEEEEDDEDIKLRLMETEAPSPSISTLPRLPNINTTPGSSPLTLHQQNVLSPVRSPDQMGASYGSSSSQFQQYGSSSPLKSSTPTGNYGFVPPPPPAAESSSFMGDGFYEDVLAAVDTNAKTLPAAAPAPRPQQQQQQRPMPPPIPQSPPSSHRSPAPAPPPPQQFVQQQHLPAPQPQHLQPMLVEQEVFGAPSPRLTPATVNSHNHSHQLQYHQPPGPSSTKPALSPRSAARPQHRPPQQQQMHEDDEEADFYASSIL